MIGHGARIGLLILIFGITTSLVRADDVIATNLCKKQDASGKAMPALAKSYEAIFLVNDPVDNITNEMSFASDGLKTIAKSTVEEFGFDFMIDHERRQIVKLDLLPRGSKHISCQVQALSSDALQVWSEGFIGNWILSWLLNTTQYPTQYMGKDTDMGIPCDHWLSCIERVLDNGDKDPIGVHFYWSDPDLWTPVIGYEDTTGPKAYSVPVRIKFDRVVNGKAVEEIVNVYRYSVPGPPTKVFDIPPGVFCPGLKGESVKLPDIPPYYSYETEVILHEDLLKNLVLYQKHYFDDHLKINRLEFSPIFGKDTVPTEGSDKPNKVGKMTIINDLNTGLYYLIDKDNGHCEFNPIDKNTDVVQEFQKTAVHLGNPMEFLTGEISYTYYQQTTERGLPVSRFMGVQKVPELKKTLIYEYWISAPFQEIQGADTWTTQKPIKFAAYYEDSSAEMSQQDNSAKFYADPVSKSCTDKYTCRVDINIFNFDTDEPDILDYDITHCTPKEKRHIIQFALIGRFDVAGKQNIIHLRRQISKSLSGSMQVSPLRIHNIQVLTDDDYTNVTFTLLEHPNIEGTVPGYTDTESDVAMSNLQTKIDSGTFVVVNEGAIEKLWALKAPLLVDGSPFIDNSTGVDHSRAMPALAKSYEAIFLVNDPVDSITNEMSFASDGLKTIAKSTVEEIGFDFMIDHEQRQIVKLDQIPRGSNHISCQVQALSSDALQVWSEGFIGNWILSWLLNTTQYPTQYKGKDTDMGIPCDHWLSSIEKVLDNGDKDLIGVHFYWSDPDLWTPVIGYEDTTGPKAYSVPVRIKFDRVVKGKAVEEIVNVYRYSIPGPSTKVFDIPPGVYCPGLKGEGVKLPDIPPYYSYETEVILHEELLKNLVLYQKHYFDDRLKINRLEFSPIFGKDTVPSEGGDKPNKVGKMTIINDLNTGVYYLIDKDNEHCECNPIVKNADVVQEFQKTLVHLGNPMEFLTGGISYTYYQETTERGLPVSRFMGVQKVPELKKTLIYEYWISAPFQEIQGEDTWTTQKPIKFAAYYEDSLAEMNQQDNSAKFYADPVSKSCTDKFTCRVDINIFNFDTDEPDVLDYDITHCTPKEKRHTVQFTLIGLYDVAGKQNIIHLRRQIAISLSDTMQVSPLRIHNIQVLTDDDYTNVTFTLLEHQNIEGTVPDYTDTESDVAMSNLQTKIDTGTFVVVNEGAITKLWALSNSLLVDGSPFVTTFVAIPTGVLAGHSSGAMVGLAFGVLFAGFAVSVLIVLLVLHVRKRPFTWPSAFEFRKFENSPDTTTTHEVNESQS